MKSRAFRWILGGIGAFFILSSLAITAVEFSRYRAQPLVFPPGSTLAEVPVGGLSQTEAVSRLETFFSLPLILEIEGSTIHTAPETLGFSFDPQALAAEALAELQPASFWAYLWETRNTLLSTNPFQHRLTLQRCWITSSERSPRAIPAPGTR